MTLIRPRLLGHWLLYSRPLFFPFIQDASGLLNCQRPILTFMRQGKSMCGPPRPLGWVTVALCLASCLLDAGCVRRRLTIRTNPPGAQVFVDNQEIGTTPCSASFVYYGTRNITLIKPGYRTEKVSQRLNPPWYEISPLDFVSENFVPMELRDERVVDVQLVPEEIVPQQKLLDRAQSLRDSARTGTVTPLNAAPIATSPPPALIGLPGQGLPGGQPLPYEPLPSPGAAAPPFRP